MPQFKLTVLRNCAAAAIFSVAFGGIACAQQVVKIAIAGDYAPWNMTSPSGKLIGFEPDLMHYLCKTAGLKCEFVPQPWDGMISALQAGKFDAIVDAISITPAREKVIAFSLPYASTPAGFEIKVDGRIKQLPDTGKTVCLKGPDKDAADFTALRAALKGKTIGIQTGTVYTTFIQNTFGDIAKIRTYNSPAERDMAIETGRVDVGFDDATYIGYAISQPGGDKLKLSGPLVAGPIWGPGEGIGLRLNETALKAKFDAAIKQAIATGEIKTLSLKWLKVDVTPVASGVGCGG